MRNHVCARSQWARTSLARLLALGSSVPIVRAHAPRLVICLVFCLAASCGVAQNVSPSSLSFGNEAVGFASQAKSTTVTNGRKVAVTITSIAIDLPDYSESNNCPLSPATLAPGASCNISVAFSPTVIGTRKGYLTITDSSVQRVALSGNGILAVAANPLSLAFGNEVVGRKSGSKAITVKNNQPSGLIIGSIGSSLPDYLITSDTCPLSPSMLAAGASCKITVVFSPTALGARDGVLTVADNASNSPTIALTGTGVPAVAVGPASLTYSGQPLGTTSSSQIVTLVNNQSTQLTITSVTSSLADFGLASTCPAKLAGGASCSVAVTFAPKATGSRNGTLTFVDNANNSPQSVTLAGTGLPATVVSLAITPPNPSVTAGSNQQFTALGTYSDGTQQDLTAAVNWTSSNTGVATISGGGLATTLTSGTATISASSGAVASSTLLTVSSGPILSRLPEQICMTESQSSFSLECTLPAGIPAGDGVVLFITSTIPQTLVADAVQDSQSNVYTVLGNPASGGFATIYSAYSRLATPLQAGDVITINVPGADSWGVAVYDIGPTESGPADVGVTFQNQNVGPADVVNPDTGVPGWWTGQTAPTTGTSDMCMAAIGVGSANYSGNTGDGTPPAITVFAADNAFTRLNITQTYAQSDPNYSTGGAILTTYSEVPSGTAAQSHVVNSGFETNTAPAALYCFKEAPGSVKRIPWFTGNYCTGTMSCTIDNVVAGHMLVIGSHSYIHLPTTPITVTDSQPETVTFDQLDGSVGLGSWHISPVVNGGSHTITINDSVDPDIGMVVAEIAGQASGNPVEAVAQNSIIDSALRSVNITTQTPGDLLFSWGRSYFGSDEGQGFTAIRVMPTAEYAVAPAAGLQTMSILPRGTPPWSETGIQAMAIRPAGSSAPPALAPSFTGNYCIGYIANSCTLNNVAAGDILVISSLAGGSLDQPPQVTDSLGETIVVDRGKDSDGSITLSTWHIAAVTTAGTHTITLDNAVVMIVTEYTSQSQGNPIDAVTAATATTGGFASASVQTTQGNDLIYAWCATDSPTGWGDGFAAFWTSPTSQYRMAGASPGSETATCPSSPDNPASGWVIQELAIRH